MKHFNEAEYFKRLKERIELFFGSFFEVCGIELQTLQEYHEFLDSSIEVTFLALIVVLLILPRCFAVL